MGTTDEHKQQYRVSHLEKMILQESKALLSRRAVLVQLLGTFTLPFLSSCTSHAGPTPQPTPTTRLARRTYWPNTTWRTSTPEAQGMDPARLAHLHQSLEDDYPLMRSVLIVRHGYIVFEDYQHHLTQNDYHNVHSVTKSVTSALVGIALKEKFLNNLDQKMLSFFPEITTTNIDAQMKAITLKHLLTMTTGIDWADYRPNSANEQKNYIQFAFHLPIAFPPGHTFNYDTLTTEVVSGILTKATHMSALEYGMRTLFTPLGIARPPWLTDAQGYNTGGLGLSLKARDMAKVGYLYLNDGEWDGQQILSADWVQASTQQQNAGGPPEGEGYGYLWWTTSVAGHHAYFAAGFGGQYIYVVPDLDLVVAIASNPDITQDSKQIIPLFIIPAIM